MASTSTSSIQKRFKYDVFLSFRGEDTRKTFVDHLYKALDDKGIITYKDDERIEKGEMIDEQLLRSIEESRFYIIVFSKNYASSSWCLKELVKIMDCQKMKEHIAYPIFYDVEPTEVRNRSGSVGEAFAKHEKEESTRKRKRTLEDAVLENEDDVARWRNALKGAAGLAGMELKNTFNGHEAKFIQKIVVDVSLKLSFINWRVDEDFVGMETRVESIVSYLEIGSEDVRMIGILGMGGGGKTNLATAVFDRISYWFDGTSFVENVREVSTSSLSGLKELQKKVLSDALNDQSIVVKSVSDGKNKMIKMMGSRKVLVVLDDVDNIGQLEALAGKRNWFKPGSRIIITTRDEQVLVSHRVNFIHHLKLLSDEEAFCLFSRHAFGREIPIEGYEELSRKVIHYAAGLPLTTKVLGSFLCGRSELEWVDAIERLKTIPLKETLEKLELSYNGLENDQKEIFLDIVCLLKGEEKKGAIRILESCGYKAQIGLRILEQKSLITVSDDIFVGLRFHDHIEEMGWNIVRRLHPDEPSKHSRLWIEEEIEHVLVNDLGTEAIRSIQLKGTDLHPAIIMKGLRKMGKLRYLSVSNVYRARKVDGETIFGDDDKYLNISDYLPDALQYLYWHEYPFSWLPKTFQAHELVYLEMYQSNILELWEGGERKVLKRLRFLYVKWSKLRTFDLGLTPHLEELNLQGCSHFVELHVPFECLNLKSINLMNTKVSYLNFNIGHLECLEKLNLADCRSLRDLPNNMCNMKCLKNLYLQGCSLLEKLPQEIGRLEIATNCESLQDIPTSICNMKSLKLLHLLGCILLEELPEELGRLECLEELNLRGCKSLRDIPKSITNMKCLKSLHLQGCNLLEKLPEEFGRLECLKELYIRGAGIRGLPQSIYQLKGLTIYGSREQLESYGFTSLKKLYEYTDSYYVEL